MILQCNLQTSPLPTSGVGRANGVNSGVELDGGIHIRTGSPTNFEASLGCDDEAERNSSIQLALSEVYQKSSIWSSLTAEPQLPPTPTTWPQFEDTSASASTLSWNVAFTWRTLPTRDGCWILAIRSSRESSPSFVPWCSQNCEKRMNASLPRRRPNPSRMS